MPSSASVAIREEKAIERIKAATGQLRDIFGDRIPDYSVGDVRVHPMERQAMTLEWCADLLEKMASEPAVSIGAIPAVPGADEMVELEVTPESEETDGGDNERAGGDLTTRITPNSVRRSKSKRN